MNQDKEHHSFKHSRVGSAVSFLLAETAIWAILFGKEHLDLSQSNLFAFLGGLLMGVLTKRQMDIEKSWKKSAVMLLMIIGMFAATDTFHRLTENQIMIEALENYMSKSFILGIATHMLLKLFTSSTRPAR